MSHAGSEHEEWLEFAPRKSYGRYWTAGFGTLFLIGFGIPLYFAREELSPFVTAAIALVGLGAAVPLFLFAWYFPSMRYWLGPEELVLSYGPLLNDRVPLENIKSIRRRNLQLALTSTSFRFPGLALFYVHYLGAEYVRMCATSVTQRVLLIDVGNRKYGITPEDEFGLVQAIRQRAGTGIRISENFNPERVSETTISR